MGKTADGAVWLNKEQRSPYEYWQYWRNTEDADVGRFLRLFTELPLDEIARLEKLGGAEINEAKKTLATAATALCHGQAAADEAAATAKTTFEQGGASQNLPTIEIPKAELEAGIPLFGLVHKAGLADSNGAARKLIQGKGVKLNDTVIEDEKRPVTMEDVNTDGAIKLSAGKKRHVLVKPA
jgi:tyrosyl-tRNA synthetase